MTDPNISVKNARGTVSTAPPVADPTLSGVRVTGAMGPAVSSGPLDSGCTFRLPPSV